MTPDQTIAYIQISDIFPDIPNNFETFKSLLSDLSLTDTLFWCARLNLIFSDPSSIDFVTRQKYFLSQFFTKEEIGLVNKFVQEQGGWGNTVLYFRGQLLELFRWVILFCDDQPGDGETFEDLDVCRKFVQAALIASDIWSKRILMFKNFSSTDKDLDFARYKALGTIRKSIEGSMRARELQRALGRGWTLFKEYFPQFYPSFDSEFLALTDLCIDDYYSCLCAVIVNCMDPKSTSGIFSSLVDGSKIQNVREFQKYLTLESQTAEELREVLWRNVQRDDIKNDEEAPPFDYTPLRNKPIFRAKDGRSIIIDPVFYSETASIGPLFHILKGSYSREKNNRIFGAFGEAFEHYVCDILHRMFNTPTSLTKRLTCNIHKAISKRKETIEMADACLNDITEVVLFEIKATTLSETTILDKNHESYLQILRKKYSKTQGTDNERGTQGVAQLARTICIIAAQKWLDENEEFSNAETVYPVLVVHDSLMTAPVYGNFLTSEFKQCFLPDAEFSTGELKKGNLRVVLPIVLTVEDLENLENSIERFGFRTVLTDYSQTCPERSMSFYNFLAFSEKYKNRIYPNRYLAGKTLEVLEKCVKNVFGKEVIEE